MNNQVFSKNCSKLLDPAFPLGVPWCLVLACLGGYFMAWPFSKGFLTAGGITIL